MPTRGFYRGDKGWENHGIPSTPLTFTLSVLLHPISAKETKIRERVPPTHIFFNYLKNQKT